MGRQVKFGVRIHQHGYTFDDLKRVLSTLAQDIGRCRATVSENTEPVTCARRAFGCFTGRKKMISMWELTGASCQRRSSVRTVARKKLPDATPERTAKPKSGDDIDPTQTVR